MRGNLYLTCVSALAGTAMFATATAAQEYIVAGKPGLKTIPVYDAPGGKKVKDLKPEAVISLRIQSVSGDWREVDIDYQPAWISAGDVMTRAGKVSTQRLAPVDLGRGATPGFGTGKR
jgi:hypothetical protein